MLGLRIDEQPGRTSSTGVTRYFFKDAQGSTVALTDSNGVVQTTYAYGPFAETVSSGQSSDNPYQFVGRENDSFSIASFYNFRARYLDTTTGRFASSDPEGFSGGSHNLYSYANSNPINMMDPTGKVGGYGPGPGLPVPVDPRPAGSPYAPQDKTLNASAYGDAQNAAAAADAGNTSNSGGSGTGGVGASGARGNGALAAALGLPSDSGIGRAVLEAVFSGFGGNILADIVYGPSLLPGDAGLFGSEVTAGVLAGASDAAATRAVVQGGLGLGFGIIFGVGFYILDNATPAY
jgi:RHS repeat-associated protein